MCCSFCLEHLSLPLSHSLNSSFRSQLKCYFLVDVLTDFLGPTTPQPCPYNKSTSPPYHLSQRRLYILMCSYLIDSLPLDCKPHGGKGLWMLVFTTVALEPSTELGIQETAKSCLFSDEREKEEAEKKSLRGVGKVVTTPWLGKMVATRRAQAKHRTAVPPHSLTGFPFIFVPLPPCGLALQGLCGRAYRMAASALYILALQLQYSP